MVLKVQPTKEEGDAGPVLYDMASLNTKQEELLEYRLDGNCFVETTTSTGV
jgi:hypothetical protein